MPKQPPKGPGTGADFDQIRSAESRQQLIAGLMALSEIAGLTNTPADDQPKEISNA